MLRPGNFEIIKAMALNGKLEKGNRILDIGCGKADTINFLKNEYEADCIGIDINLAFVNEAAEKYPNLDIRFGDGEFLDEFSSNTFDIVNMECVLSLINTPDEALHEAWCVLKKGGKLFLSDLFHINPEKEYIEEVKAESLKQAKEWRENHKESDCENRPPRKTAFLDGGKFFMGPLADELEKTGFQITWFEDRTDDLVQYMADCILDGEEESIICNVKDRKNTGYFALIAEKL